MFFITFFGPPGGIRTHYPRLRRPVLYPDELRADMLLDTVSFRPDGRPSCGSVVAKNLADPSAEVYKETRAANVG